MTKLPVLLAALFVLWTTCPGVQAAGRTLQTAAAPTTTSGVSDVGRDDYVYLGCVGNVPENPTQGDAPAPALETPLVSGTIPVDTTDCASAAKRAGKRFFGTSASSLCMAGSSLIRALKHTYKRAVCDQPCADTDLPGRRCGGGGDNYATSLYVLKSGKDYTNLGCYALRADKAPLPQLVLDSPKMTPGFCYRKAAAYRFFAVFNGTRCYGGNSLGPSLRHGRGSKGCTTPCSSNNKQTCGGPEAFMVYVNHAAAAPPPPVVLMSVESAPDAAPSPPAKTDFSYKCPEGSFITSFFVRSGDWIDHAGAICNDAASTKLGPAGGNGGEVTRTHSNPQGFTSSTVYPVDWTDSYVGAFTLATDNRPVTVGNDNRKNGSKGKASSCDSGKKFVGISGDSAEFLNSLSFICG